MFVRDTITWQGSKFTDSVRASLSNEYWNTCEMSVENLAKIFDNTHLKLKFWYITILPNNYYILSPFRHSELRFHWMCSYDNFSAQQAETAIPN
jgi:hypothetical protein